MRFCDVINRLYKATYSETYIFMELARSWARLNGSLPLQVSAQLGRSQADRISPYSEMYVVVAISSFFCE